MAKKIIKKTVSRDLFKEYLKVAEQNFQAARNNMEDELWTSSGILIVHSAIAYTDALTIKSGGVKSTGEQHSMAADLLYQLLELSQEDQKAISRFRRIISEKTKVSYGGKMYSETKVRQMWINLERYRDWVNRKIKSIE